ncbi:MAG: T9SS type A sorting domain-containing protein [Flavobacteriaceae bacterium]
MKKITLIFTLLLLTALSWQSNAQLSPDNSCTTAFDDISTTGTDLLLGDDGETAIIMPFVFTLDGVSSTDLFVGNNGGVLFGVTTGNVGYTIPSDSGFFPFAQDIDSDYGTVVWETLGTAPNRRVVIMWNDRPHYSNSPSGATFEMILHETTNEITFLYQDMDFGVAASLDGADAEIGIVGANGTYTYSMNTAITGITCINWTIPTCLPASALAISNETTTSADLAWTDSNGLTATDYEYVVQAAGTGMPTGTGTATTANPQSLTGLNSSTLYEVWLRAICSTTDASDWVSVDFGTLCDSFGSFTEDFDTTADGAMALCWSTIVTSTSTFARVTVEDNLAYTEPNSVELYNSDDLTAELLLITPQLTDLPLDTHRLKFWVSGGTSAGDDFGLLVGTMTDPTDATTFTPVAGIAAPAGFNEHIIPFTASTSDQYIAFKHAVGATFQTLKIDDVAWEPIPACIEVSDIAVSAVTTTDATLTWTENNTVPATAWEYVIQAPGTGMPAGAGTATATNPVTDMSLAANTAYEVYVRSMCSTTDFSPWVGPVNFSTPCDVFSTPYHEDFEDAGDIDSCWMQETTDNFDWTAHTSNTGSSNTGPSAASSGTYYIYCETSSPVTWGDVASILSPNIDLTGLTTARLNFQYHMYGAGMEEDGSIKVDISTDGGATFSNIFIEEGDHGDQWNSGFVDLSSYSGVVSFKISGTVSTDNTLNAFHNDFAIDEFIVEETPATAPICAANIVGADVDAACGNRGVAITWDATTGADGYKITVGTAIGLNDIEDATDLGTALTYTIATTIQNTEYFYTITPYNAVGDATGCTEESFTTFVDGCYCASAPTSLDGNGVSNVQIDATDFVSLGAISYEDHTATPVDINRGFSNNLQVTFETVIYDYDTHVWIDLNDDLIFDNATELLFSGLSGTTSPNTLDASFLLDAAAALGQHRMRIGTADTGQVTADSCYSGSYGVTLDFTVNVLDPPCAQASVTSTVVPDCTNMVFSIDIDVTSVGDATEITDGTDTYPITATGVITVGPYTDGTSVDLSITHTDTACDLSLSTITYTCPPTNDLCADAQALIIGVDFVANELIGNNIAATDSGELVPGCASYSGGDVWYSAVVPSDGILTFEVNTETGGLGDTGGAVYSGTCGALTLISCNDDGSLSGAHPIINISDAALAGQTLYFRVWEYGNDATGAFKVSAYNPNAASTQDLTAVGFNYYPNPVSNELTMTATENISSVKVYNMLGQEVKTITPSSLEASLDMTNLTAGTYFVKAQVGESVGTFKIVKK